MEEMPDSVEQLRAYWAVSDAGLELARSSFQSGYHLGVQRLKIIAGIDIIEAVKRGETPGSFDVAFDGWIAAALDDLDGYTKRIFDEGRGN
jgi:hypothetical protein